MPRILIAEDDDHNREAMKLVIGAADKTWKIMTAHDEAEAKAVVKQQIKKGDPVDVVLTDLDMRASDGGMTLIREVRTLDPRIMAILYTGKEHLLNRLEALEIGAFDVVEKTIRGKTAITELIVKTKAALAFRESARRVDFLRRYFDPKVFDAIERNESQLKMQQRIITICFWDVREFSKMCQTLTEYPERIADFLRAYCDMVAQTIFKHDGVLDKFIGDGVMALFGALDSAGQTEEAAAIAAVQTAQEVREQFPTVLEAWKLKLKFDVAASVEIGVGCGIHTGRALVGNAGTSFRDQYTALGPHVNLASRIENRARSGEILLSQTTEARVHDVFLLKEHGEITNVKNIEGTFRIYLA